MHSNYGNHHGRYDVDINRSIPNVVKFLQKFKVFESLFEIGVLCQYYSFFRLHSV